MRESCKVGGSPRQSGNEIEMMSTMKSSALLIAPLAALFLNSCATNPSHEMALRQAVPPRDDRPVDGSSLAGESGYSYFTDAQAEAALRVRIDLSEQTAIFYRGGVKVGQSRVATGRSGHSTPTGSFTISEKVADKRSNLYGRIYDAQGNVVVSDADRRRHSVPRGGRFVGAPMPYWMRLTSYGIGMHVGPIPNPGSPASHGCVRMPAEMARVLFAKAPVGTMVSIVP